MDIDYDFVFQGIILFFTIYSYGTTTKNRLPSCQFFFEWLSWSVAIQQTSEIILAQIVSL